MFHFSGTIKCHIVLWLPILVFSIRTRCWDKYKLTLWLMTPWGVVWVPVGCYYIDVHYRECVKDTADGPCAPWQQSQGQGKLRILFCVSSKDQTWTWWTWDSRDHPCCLGVLYAVGFQCDVIMMVYSLKLPHSSTCERANGKRLGLYCGRNWNFLCAYIIHLSIELVGY